VLSQSPCRIAGATFAWLANVIVDDSMKTRGTGRADLSAKCRDLDMPNAIEVK
jgi:hypothetical protein